MKRTSGLLKIGGAALLASLVLLLYLLPAKADDPDIQLTLEGAGGPDVDINNPSPANEPYLAVVYYEQDPSIGRDGVYLKSAENTDGWVSPRFLGVGSSPQVAFNRGINSKVVYVVWVNSDDTAIQAIRCTLNSTTAPTCGSVSDIYRLPTGSTNALAEPDLAVDGNNVLHVAWQNQTAVSAIIETKRSTNADDVSSWQSNPATPVLCSGGKASGPVLGWTSNKIHLAFLCGSSATAPTSVEYRRSGVNSHIWTDASVSFTTGSGGSDAINTTNTQLDGLALNASGSQVSLAWDGRLGASSQEFSLMYVASTDAGTTWGTVNYIPSSPEVPASANPQANNQNKLSTSSTLPPQEFGLRPSLVISGTAGNAIVAWQQKLNGGACQDADNGSSDIHFVDPQNSPASLDTLQHTNKSDYSIDPHLVKGPTGVRHFVFMKDINAVSCTGGTAADYAIYYRGTITKTISGHLQTADGVYLPLIKK